MIAFSKSYFLNNMIYMFLALKSLCAFLSVQKKIGRYSRMYSSYFSGVFLMLNGCISEMRFPANVMSLNPVNKYSSDLTATPVN